MTNDLTPNEIMVLDYLGEKKLTVRGATLYLNLNGGTFTKVVSDLIKKGYPITSVWKSRRNRNGKVKRYKVYSWSEE